MRQATFVLILAGLPLGSTLQSPSAGDHSPTSGSVTADSAVVHPSRARTDDILEAALRAELPPLPPARVRTLLTRINDEARAIRTQCRPQGSADEVIGSLNSHFFGPEGFTGLTDPAAPENTSVAAVLDRRRGTCVGLAIVYLSLAQRLGLDAYAVATPVHVFVRVRLEGGLRNVELLEAGREIDDDTYRRRYRIDRESIAAGAFMTDLSTDQLLAHLLSNQAVALTRQGRVRAALRRYDRALRLHPRLVAAWYNRGIDLMNAGRFDEALDSFGRSIELYPSDAQAHNNRGLARLKLGDVEGARADFARALELEPSLVEAVRNLNALPPRGADNP